MIDHQDLRRMHERRKSFSFFLIPFVFPLLRYASFLRFVWFHAYKLWIHHNFLNNDSYDSLNHIVEKSHINFIVICFGKTLIQGTFMWLFWMSFKTWLSNCEFSACAERVNSTTSIFCCSFFKLFCFSRWCVHIAIRGPLMRPITECIQKQKWLMFLGDFHQRLDDYSDCY